MGQLPTAKSIGWRSRSSHDWRAGARSRRRRGSSWRRFRPTAYGARRRGRVSCALNSLAARPRQFRGRRLDPAEVFDIKRLSMLRLAALCRLTSREWNTAFLPA